MTPTGTSEKIRQKQVLLYGPGAQELGGEVSAHPGLTIVESSPDVVICYGGDGTLLAAEAEWPGIPKVPVLNSRIGHHCIHEDINEVIARLARDELVANKFSKLRCAIHCRDHTEPGHTLTPLNEISVQKKRINSAVRFQLWIDGEEYAHGLEIVGDGFIVCTPFGSTAYFSKITRGAFMRGMGIAFCASDQRTNHIVVPPKTRIRLRITRGPAILAHDSSQEYVELTEGDELVVRKHPHGATLLPCGPARSLDKPF